MTLATVLEELYMQGAIDAIRKLLQRHGRNNSRVEICKKFIGGPACILFRELVGSVEPLLAACTNNLIFGFEGRNGARYCLAT